MREFYLYSEKKINRTIREMFIDFKINLISEEKIKKNNFINQNILLITGGEGLKHFNRSFLINNNVVIFYTTRKNINKQIFFDAKVFNKHVNVNKFIDEVKAFFVVNSFNYQDLKLIGDKIINNKTEKEIFLTTLEKNILMSLINQEMIEKNFLLESVLKIKKDTATKTIESHLTRIRNKLSKINSKLKIISKGDKVFLTH